MSGQTSMGQKAFSAFACLVSLFRFVVSNKQGRLVR